MAQHDYSIANQGFPATRADINNVLSAIATNNSGTSAPSTQYAGQFWIDTTSSTWTMYIHDGADDIQFATIDTSANTVNFIDSALASDVVINTSGAITTTGAFTSLGIDDNASSTAVTIDASGNLLVDKTSSNYQTVGHELRDGGRAFHTADGDKALSLNRLTSDGAIIDLYKDGTTVGSISSDNSSNLTIQGKSSSDFSILFGTNKLNPKNHAGTGAKDNAVDLGDSDDRWKDLYLGGGLYVGGTGTANKLSDYEEGLHSATITDTGGTATITMNTSYDQLSYTKIGRLVHVQGTLLIASISATISGTVRITLPFAASSLADQSGKAVIGVGTYNVNFTSSGTAPFLHVGENNAYGDIRVTNDNLNTSNAQFGDTSIQIYIGGTYITDA